MNKIVDCLQFTLQTIAIFHASTEFAGISTGDEMQNAYDVEVDVKMTLDISQPMCSIQFSLHAPCLMLKHNNCAENNETLSMQITFIPFQF